MNLFSCFAFFSLLRTLVRVVTRVVFANDNFNEEEEEDENVWEKIRPQPPQDNNMDVILDIYRIYNRIIYNIGV